jgi:iron(III) transport system permease protein
MTTSFNRKIKTYFNKPANVILVVAAVILIVFVLLPLFSVVSETFIVHDGEQYRAQADVGSFTFFHWSRVLFTFNEIQYSLENFYKPLWNSVLMGVLACFFAILIGGVTAFLVARTNVPFRKFISAVFIFPYIMPSWSIAMFWENFFRNSGLTVGNGAKGMLQMMTGAITPQWMVYGLIPCSIALAIHYAPFAYILIGGVLRNMDSNLEEAAQILKANRWQILTKITIPMILPAIVSTVLLVFASSLSSYTVPAMLGTPTNFMTLSSQTKGFMGHATEVGMGYVTGVVMLGISVVILLINNKTTNKRKSYVTISGKSSQISKINLGKYGKWVIGSILIIFVSFFSIMPMINFALESFLEKSGDLSSFTFKYWISTVDTDAVVTPSTGLLLNPSLYKAIGGSLLISGLVALVVGTGGLLIGYGVTRNKKSKLSGLVSTLSFLPYLIPAMSFGLIYYGISLNPALYPILHESILLLVIVGSVKFLPFASRGGTSAMLQISNEIEESAIIQGAPWGKRMTKIIIPIQKTSIISGYLLPFISCMRELSLFVLIATSGTILTSLLTLYQAKGAGQMANGLNLIIVLLVLGINFIVNKLTGASIDKGVGGE